MISVHEAEKLSLQQIEQFLLAAKEVGFGCSQGQEVYGWVKRLLCGQEYARQGRRARGLLRRYLGKMTGLSRAQFTRLVGRYLATGQVRRKSSRRHRFPTRYSRADIELLALVDEAHESLSGPAPRRILQREFRQYGKPEFQRLAGISNGHLYNLRRTPRYRQRLQNYHKTRPTPVAIGERRRPDPAGRPGYLRLDTYRRCLQIYREQFQPSEVLWRPAERTWPGCDGRMAFGVHAVAAAGHGLCEVCCSSVRLVAGKPRGQAETSSRDS